MNISLRNVYMNQCTVNSGKAIMEMIGMCAKTKMWNMRILKFFL